MEYDSRIDRNRRLIHRKIWIDPKSLQKQYKLHMVLIGCFSIGIINLLLENRPSVASAENIGGY